MFHNIKCCHCSHSIPTPPANQPAVCTNCCATAATQPILPWERCKICGKFMVVAHMNWRERLLFLWPLFIGVPLFIISLLAANGRWEGIGLVITAWFFLGRLIYYFQRDKQVELVRREHNRTAFAAQLRGQPEITEEDKKRLDDLMDKVLATIWIQKAIKRFRITLALLGILVISCIITSWGPGDVLFPWSLKSWAESKAQEVKQSELTQKLALDFKQSSDWDEQKLSYVRNQLRNERGVNEKQFLLITHNPNLSLDKIIDELRRHTDYEGDRLFSYLVSLSPAPKAQAAASQPAEEKGHTQKVREAFWSTMLWVNAVLLLALVAWLIGGLISLVAFLALSVGDEVKDNFLMMLEKYGKKGVQAAAEAPAEAIGGSMVKHSLLIAGISFLADFVYEKLFGHRRTV